MGRVLYLKFIGAQAIQEAKNSGLCGSKSLVLLERDLVVDCGEKAWADGVRPGDTLRQARISSPACKVLRVGASGGECLKDMLDILAKVSPYVEPVADQSGVFVDIPFSADPAEVLDSLKGLYLKVFAAVSNSKLVSRAVCDFFMQQHLNRGKISSGNTKWGFVRKENDRVLAVIDCGKEKAFISGAPLDSLWMAPPEVLSTLRSLGLKRIKDLQEVSTSALVERAGDWAVIVKRWSVGEEHSRVQALYPPPSLTKEVNFLEPVPVRKELFHEALKELASLLIEKGVGFKSIRLCLSGDFGSFSGNQSGERRFVRPVSSLEAMCVAVSAILGEIFEEIVAGAGPASLVPVLSGFRLKLLDIVPVQAKPSPLFDTGAVAKPKVVPVALGLALFGLEDKFGDRIVAWGKKEPESEMFKPEITRREKMLSIWDPMRPQSFDQATGSIAAGGVADV